MIRVEIIANQSMQEKIVNNLEAAIPGFLYTVIPLVHGRGKKSRKLGTTTWPETNVIIIAYCSDEQEKTVRTVVQYIKEKFPDEGIKIFVLHDRG
ncbi:PG0541 family transporter-associated protein [Treponema sp.]|uniref:PG0541 family transporter-associated protein n=1 Tax=Treponema sp. TaxID=166 RepID=UPI003F0BB1AC